MNYSEDELIQLSALEHFLFCERQCALIHIEQLWNENLFTAEGRQLHERADTPETEVRDGIRIVRGLYIHSFRLGLTGRADVVEFHPVENTGANQAMQGVSLENVSGRWIPKPIEYKRGRRRYEAGFEVQLCAQARCLEEMLNVEISGGAIYFGKTHRRKEIAIDEQLRRQTISAAERLHALIDSRQTPKAVREPKCEHCSLIHLCLPDAMSLRQSAKRYLLQSLSHMEGTDE